MSSVSTLAAGIFANEAGQRLLHILLSLGDRGFKGLYEKCARNLEGEYYQQGLCRVHAWSHEVIFEDIAFVCKACPDFEETFDSCFVQYVGDRFRGRKRPTAKTPALPEFVRRFLESLGQHETLYTGDYFAKRDTLLKRVACMDACRQALYALVTSDNVRVELLSEVEAQDDVTPDDSVSCVAFRAALPPASVVQEPPAPPPRSVVQEPTTPPPPRSVVQEPTTPPPPPPRSVVQEPTAPPPPPPRSVVQDPASIVQKAVRPPSVVNAPPATVVLEEKARADDNRSIISRHDFVAVETEDAPSPPQVVSSARSNVSIGVKQTRPPS